MRLSKVLPRRLLSSSSFAFVGKRVFPRGDLALQRLSHGRASLTAGAGVPLLLLETTGRRTGQPRVTPLTYASQGTDFLVAGSNWGQERHPAWALNLLATPKAAVSLRGKRIAVTARALYGAEWTEAWQLLLDVWPVYDDYVARVHETSGREIMVFRLERR
ncbi:MAG TPA: nitroreductase/quinone reductase family protein [Actinospica sp.]|jgi:deazaflavin-dependent oxidoreductase (nitroreductase family)|nr:nitroreductase/quinone reductase family protein [Actinospica sp.]